ncbi:MFS transporter [Leuconostoc lactis]
MNIEYNLLFEMAMFLLVGVEMLVLPNIYVILGTIFLNGYFAGISNPKIDTFIIQNLPEEKIGGGMGAFYTVVTLGLPIGTAIAGVIAMSVSTIFGWQLLAIITCFGVVYLIFLAGKYHSQLA